MIGGGLSMDCFTFAQMALQDISSQPPIHCADCNARYFKANNHLTFVFRYLHICMYLCICVFVYFCISVFVYSALIATGDISRQIIIFEMQPHFLAACGG